MDNQTSPTSNGSPTNPNGNDHTTSTKIPIDQPIQSATLNSAQFQYLTDEFVGNAMLRMKEFFSQFMDPRRNIEKECGYPELGANIDAHTYNTIYGRDPIAARIVEVMAEESWEKQPTIYEDEDSESVTPFEQAWDNLGKSLRGFTPQYDTEELGSPIWSYLLRADILSGIGSYGVILLGIDDQQPLNMPVQEVEQAATQQLTPTASYPVPRGTDAQYYDFYGYQTILYPPTPNPSTSTQSTTTTTDPASINPTIAPPNTQPTQTSPTTPSTPGTPQQPARRLIYMRVYDESLVKITRYENNPHSPRFQQPLEYTITLSDPTQQPSSGIGMVSNTVSVHWTRIIHIADIQHQASNSEVFAVPRMKTVWNEILNLRKVYGASAEGSWQSSFPILSLETHPNLGTDARINKTYARDQYEQLMNGLQRGLLLEGMTAKTLPPQVADPTNRIDKGIEAICIKLRMPIRVFKGSERGELASTQDDASWNDRKDHRRKYYVTPLIILPVIDRLILMRVLPLPKRIYADWPELDSTTDMDKARISRLKSDTILRYVTGGGEQAMAPMDFWTRIMGYNEVEAQTIIDNQKEFMEQLLAEQQSQLQQQMESGTAHLDEFGNPIPNPNVTGGPNQSGSNGKAKGKIPRNVPGEDTDLREEEIGDVANRASTGINANCGGEGSGKPGPCPEGKMMHRGVGTGADTHSGFEWYSTSHELAKRYAEHRGGSVKSDIVKYNNPVDIGNSHAVLDARSFMAKALDQTDAKSLDKAKALQARSEFLKHFGNDKREVIDYWSNPDAKEATRKLLEAFGFDAIHMVEGGEPTIAVLRKK